MKRLLASRSHCTNNVTVSLDGGHGAATTAIDGRDLGAGSTSLHRDPYIGLLEDELAELIRQYEMMAGQCQ